MTDYTNISNVSVEPLAPVTSELMTALRDNPIAICEGATGAPSIRTVALQQPSAGDTIILRLVEGALPTDNTGYPPGGEKFYPNQGVGFNALVSGVVRVKAEQVAGSGGGSYMRVCKNGTVLEEWTTSSTGYVARSLDVTVAVGDLVTIQHRSSSTGILSQVRNIRVSSSTPDMAVV